MLIYLTTNVLRVRGTHHAGVSISCRHGGVIHSKLSELSVCKVQASFEGSPASIYALNQCTACIECLMCVAC